MGVKLNMGIKLRVSDIITEDKIKSWEQGSVITIEAGTGQGKSFFIKNGLYEFAKKNNKKILMLIHRLNCVDQFQAEIERDNKTDIIDIVTYQKLEHLYKTKQTFDFDQYEYLICDEFHYFLSDSSFSKTTDISLNTILSQQDKTRIFMSATGDYMKRYINKIKQIDTTDYKLPNNFQFIRELFFFNKDETMESFIQGAIEHNYKSIFFIQSATKAYELYKKFGEVAVFNCGKSDKHYKYVDKDKINNILKNERFEELMLITTTCFDAGVNIIDEELTHVVCDVQDIDVLTQCIGRKRPQHNKDKINLHIKTITNQQLGGIETQLNKKVAMADYLNEYTVKEFIEKYPREHDKYDIIYDEIVEEDDKCTKKINELMRFKCKIDVAKISSIKNLGDFSYCKHLAREFGFYDVDLGYFYIVVEDMRMKDELEGYLDSIVGEKLFNDEQKALINKIDLKVNGRQQKSYKKLNDGLEMINLPFIIIPKKSGSKRYWIIEKVEL